MALVSVVDYLDSLGQDSSYGARKNLASQYGIQNYSGTANQNIQLLSSLQSGQKSSGAAQTGSTPGPAATIVNPGASPGPAATIVKPSSSSENVILGVGPGESGSGQSAQSEYLTGYKNNSFTTSGRTDDYYDILQDLEANKPGDYQSRWDADINSIIDSIMNRPQFDQSDVFDSDLYKMYREQYIQQGQKAMRDTMGAAQAMTGGYGSTYAQAAGQQAYDSYLSQLGDQTLNIYDRIYNQYLQEGQELYNQLGMLNNQDSIDYGRYRDTVSDYYSDLAYYSGRYDSEWSHDFSQYQANQDAMRWAEEYAYQKTQDALAQQNWKTQFDYQKEQDALAKQNWQAQFDYQKEQDALAMALAQQKAASSGGGSSRRSSGGSSSGASSGSGSSKEEPTQSQLVEFAKYLLNETDDNGEYLHDSGSVMTELRQYGVTGDELETIIKKAGGNVDIGKNSQSNTFKKWW